MVKKKQKTKKITSVQLTLGPKTIWKYLVRSNQHVDPFPDWDYRYKSTILDDEFYIFGILNNGVYFPATDITALYHELDIRFKKVFAITIWPKFTSRDTVHTVPAASVKRQSVQTPYRGNGAESEQYIGTVVMPNGCINPIWPWYWVKDETGNKLLRQRECVFEYAGMAEEKKLKNRQKLYENLVQGNDELQYKMCFTDRPSCC